MKDQGGGEADHGKDVQTILQEQFDVHCNKRTVYKLLHRAKLSWVSGRSKNPKQDLDAQEAFKKTLPHT